MASAIIHDLGALRWLPLMFVVAQGWKLPWCTSSQSY